MRVERGARLREFKVCGRGNAGGGDSGNESWSDHRVVALLNERMGNRAVEWELMAGESADERTIARGLRAYSGEITKGKWERECGGPDFFFRAIFT